MRSVLLSICRVDRLLTRPQIMKSYESSTATLRVILAHPSLQRNKIEETMDAMAEANADAKDVEEAIKIGGDIALGVEDGAEDELQEELKALVREVEAQKIQAGRVEENADTEKLEGLNVPEGIPIADEMRVAEFA